MAVFDFYLQRVLKISVLFIIAFCNNYCEPMYVFSLIHFALLNGSFVRTVAEYWFQINNRISSSIFCFRNWLHYWQIFTENFAANQTFHCSLIYPPSLPPPSDSPSLLHFPFPSLHIVPSLPSSLLFPSPFPPSLHILLLTLPSVALFPLPSHSPPFTLPFFPLPSPTTLLPLWLYLSSLMNPRLTQSYDMFCKRDHRYCHWSRERLLYHKQLWKLSLF